MQAEDIRREVLFTAVRSRGPGGQNVNKVSSAAVLYWDFEKSRGLTAPEKDLVRTKLWASINKEKQFFLRSDEFRDLERNKSRCLEKLFDLLEFAFYKPKKRKATRPTYSSKVRKREGKKRRSETKVLRQRLR